MVFTKGAVYYYTVALLCAYTLVVASEASLSPHSEHLVRMFRDYLTNTENSLDQSTVLEPVRRQTEAYKTQNFAIWYDPNSGMKICERNITKEILECIDGQNNCKYMDDEMKICKSKDAAKTLGCLKTCDLCDDKCASGEHNCHQSADCITDSTSFTCKCKKGYKGDGVNTCTDVDECAENTHTCLSYQNCTNEIGSFRCETSTSAALQTKAAVCRTGYEANSLGSCVDINECSSANGCDKNAYCINTLGSYTCKCKTGYLGSGSFCVDKDECRSTNLCHQNANCNNTLGTYSCKCKTGFSGDGYTCNDINECDRGMRCPANSYCNNTQGSYVCPCVTGFLKNGTVCTDINECDTVNCGPRADCVNNPGSYECKCKSAYKKVGDKCQLKTTRRRSAWW